MQDLADHPFSAENIAYESCACSNKSEAAWLKFVAECERLLGHDLDGNDPDAFGNPGSEAGDGYSLDEAGEYFDRGATAHAYVAIVGSRERYRGRQ